MQLQFLVAGECRRLSRKLTNDLLRAAHFLRAGRGRRACALLPHQPGELLVAAERNAALGGDLPRQLDREAERVVQLEGVGGAEVTGVEQAVEQFQPGIERAAEAFLLGSDPLENRLAPADQVGIGGAHLIDHLLGELRQEHALDADALSLLHRASHDAAQDVAAVLVRRHDPVTDQERHRA